MNDGARSVKRGIPSGTKDPISEVDRRDQRHSYYRSLSSSPKEADNLPGFTDLLNLLILLIIWVLPPKGHRVETKFAPNSNMMKYLAVLIRYILTPFFYYARFSVSIHRSIFFTNTDSEAGL